MEFVFFKNRKKNQRFVFISALLLFLVSLSAAASVILSAVQVSRCERIFEKILSGRQLQRKEVVDLGLSREKILARVFSGYTKSEILAAGLLLEGQGFHNMAETFFFKVSANSDSLSEMGQSLLADSLLKRKKWKELASFCELMIKGENSGAPWFDLYYKALVRGGIHPSPDISLKDREILWAIPFLEEKEQLSQEKLYRILLSYPLTDLFEFMEYWHSPFRDDSGISQILDFRTALEERDNTGAEKQFQELWEAFFSDFTLLPENFLLELRDMLRNSRNTSYWIKEFQFSSVQYQGFAGAFLVGSLQEHAGHYESALESYSLAGLKARGFDEKRRSQWYELRILIRYFPDLVLSFLIEHASSWGNSSYFDDLLDEYFSYLVRTEDWDVLNHSVKILAGTDLTSTVSQGVFLLNTAVESGKLDAPDYLTSQFVSEHIRRDKLGYYSLVSYPEIWPYRRGQDVFPKSAELSTEAREVQDVYAILLQAGKVDLGWTLWNDRKDSLGPDLVAAFSSRLFQQQEFYRCIQFSGFWFYRWPSGYAVNLLPWLYPQDRDLPVYEYSRKYDIPEELILGIIRRESAFHSSIESHAGAVGLMQLMPSTASDLASRYRMQDWNLTNPSDNIRLGTAYIDWLKERYWTENYAEILAAYNGGGGNLRKWKRIYGDQDIQLFIQGIPYQETRNYVRKVIVAAASYRYLNTGQPPAEWIDQFFEPFPAM